MESAANMIVHSAGRHFAQGKEIHFERLLAGFAFRTACIQSRQKIECDRPRKLRRSAKSAFARIEATMKLLVSVFKNAGVDLSGRVRLRVLRFAERFDNF